MWNEGKIARILARNTFDGHLCVLPNCTWTGCEIDLLVVAPCRRIIDVEIKVSRADLKADKHKDKWWHYPRGVWNAELGRSVRPERIPKQWPTRTWKHYYAMPHELWRDDLMEHIQPVSGVLLVKDPKNSLNGRVECIKRAKPDSTAPVLNDEQVVRIARLTSLRMWDAYKEAERAAEPVGE